MQLLSMKQSPWRYDQEGRSPIPVDQKQRRLIAGGPHGLGKPSDRGYRLTIHLLNHIALLETSLGGSAGGIDAHHDDTFRSRRQLELRNEVGRQFPNGNPAERSGLIASRSSIQFGGGGRLAELHGQFARCAVPE